MLQEFEQQNDAKDAIQTMDKKKLYDEVTLTVEQARKSGRARGAPERGPRRGSPEGSQGDRRGPQTGDRCYRCNGTGHW